MNGDLISREALKKALKSNCDLCHDKNTNWCEHCCPLNDFEDLIDNAPTVDIKDEIAGAYNEGYMCGSREAEKARPQAEKARPQGEWIVTAEDNDGVHRICCPFCSYEKGSNNTDAIIVTFTDFPKFCENCGADMREGGTE